MLSLVCIARKVFFFSLGRVHVCQERPAHRHCIDKGQGYCIFLTQKENSSYNL
ncbi:unnamed protein product [Staurois parvus]|uniref:Uncharacterized protein n=1 Tax=Staurois parvus TaxID=386267 RepID=A0ABN9ARA7_9NEOB|nr:unnamed protein product [Staurois parvus]